MGSVADAVMRHVQCSVELVRIPKESCSQERTYVPWMASEQLETTRSEKNFGGCALKCFWS